jgi:hypothetical protein
LPGGQRLQLFALTGNLCFLLVELFRLSFQDFRVAGR